MKKTRLKITYNSPVILSFVLICLIVTILGEISNYSITRNFFTVYDLALTNPLTYLRLFTHVFGHMGIQHFIGNVMYLLLLGPMLEEKYGSQVMLKVILITAIVTGLIHGILFGSTGLCGASGIVFACIVLSSFTTFKEGEIPLSFILVILLFVGQEIYNGITVHDNISNFTHIIGGIVGALLGYKLNKKKNYFIT